MAINVQDVTRIKGLIQQAEVRAAKAQGVLDNIEAKWKEDYGEGSLAMAKKAYQELQSKIEKQEARREELVKALDDLYDWDSLEDDE
jgi:tripartite-type tricarboxylate transporter receptor subunit TctC